MTPPPQPQRTIAGRFRIERLLGEGGFGSVYRAYDLDAETPVALKMLRRSGADALYRFKREFRALADLSHPNLVALYELMSEGEQWFFTMELIDGTTFTKYVRPPQSLHPPASGADGSDTWILSPLETPDLGTTVEVPRPAATAESALETTARRLIENLRVDRLRDCLRQLVEGIGALHRARTLHLDIKPSNVLVTPEGRVVILDFGLIEELGAGPDRMKLAGTPAYMSPEHVSGMPVSESSDWYSVGVMLYESLAGSLPFGGDVREVIANKIALDPPDPVRMALDAPADLKTLCRDLLRRDPAARPSSHQLMNRLGGDDAWLTAFGSQDTHFVGRREYLAALRQAYVGSRAGRTTAVFVHGGSGAGKTALITRFLDQLRLQEGALILAGRCHERESVPFKAFDGLVDALSQHLDRLSVVQRERVVPVDAWALARLFPALRPAVAAVRDLKPPGIADPLELRRRGFQAMRELLTRLGQHLPLVLFIDDLQWGDADSAALLAELLQPPGTPPLLLIVCYRTEEIQSSPMLRALPAARAARNDPSDALITELCVTDMSPAEARELALALLEEGPSEREARADHLVSESHGNPFFLGELARSQGAGGTSLDEMLHSRIARLPDEARRVAELVAVAGQPIDLSVAKQAARLDENTYSILTRLRAVHLIRVRVSVGRQEVETYHDRIRSALNQRLDAPTRRTHHRDLAVALEASGRADPESLAVHFHGAEDRDKTARYAGIAADQAFQALAFDSAARFYRLALECEPTERSAGTAEPQANIADALRVKLGDALSNAGRGQDAAEAYLEAANEAVPANSLELRRRAAWQLLISGHMQAGLAVLSDVLASLGLKLAATPRRALLSLLFRRVLVWAGRTGIGMVRKRQATADDLIRIDTFWAAAQGLAMVAPIRAADFQARHLLLAQRSGDPYRLSRALAVEAGYFAMGGCRNRLRTERLLESAGALAKYTDNPHAIALTGLIAGMAGFLEGDWRRARTLLERAEAELREKCTGVAWELATARLFWCVSLFFLGDLRELTSRLHGFLKDAEARGDVYESTDLRIRIAHAGALAADQPLQARQETSQALDRWPVNDFYIQHWWGLIANLDIDLYSGHPTAALERAHRYWPQLRRSMLLRVQYILIESLHHRARSSLAAASAPSLSDRRRLLRATESDARRIEREKTPWGDALALLLRASVAASRAENATALALLSSAAAALDGVGMALYATAARYRHGQLVGGDEGRTLVEQARSAMIQQGIRNPDRIAAMLAPGNWRITFRPAA